MSHLRLARRGVTPVVAALDTAELVGLLLANADRSTPQGGSRVRLEVAPATAHRLGLTLADAGRLAAMSLVYDEAEDQVVRVDAPLQSRPTAPTRRVEPTWWSEPLPLAA